MSYDVFISSSHHYDELADLMCTKLEEQNIRCWYYRRNHHPGIYYAAEIASIIKGVRIFIVIVSDPALHSNHILNEISLAVDNNCVLLPFKVSQVEITGALSYYLSGVTWIDAMEPEMSDRIDDLVTAVQANLNWVTRKQMSTQEGHETNAKQDVKSEPREQSNRIEQESVHGAEIVHAAQKESCSKENVEIDPVQREQPSQPEEVAAEQSTLSTDPEQLSSSSKTFTLPERMSFEFFTQMLASLLTTYAHNEIQINHQEQFTELSCNIMHSVEDGTKKKFRISISATHQQSEQVAVDVKIKNSLSRNAANVLIGAGATLAFPLGMIGSLLTGAIKAESSAKDDFFVRNALADDIFTQISSQLHTAE